MDQLAGRHDITGVLAGPDPQIEVLDHRTQVGLSTGRVDRDQPRRIIRLCGGCDGAKAPDVRGAAYGEQR